MLTTIQIAAILSVLLSFGVDLNTVNQIKAEITPVEASTTPVVIVPVTTTPIVQDQPVYFGSTAPVNNSPVVKTPVVESVPMDTTPPLVVQFTIDSIGQRSAESDNGAPAGNYLRVASNEPLDFSKTTLSVGTLGTITYDGKQDSVARFTKGGPMIPTYYYEALVTGVSGDVDVTIQDLAGNTLTKTIRL